MRRHTSSDKRKEKARDAWGTSPSSVADIIQVFVKYTSGAQICSVAVHLSRELMLLGLQLA
jgi:hypothetical protein